MFARQLGEQMFYQASQNLVHLITLGIGVNKLTKQNFWKLVPPADMTIISCQQEQQLYTLIQTTRKPTADMSFVIWDGSMTIQTKQFTT